MRFLRQNTAVLVTCGPFYDKTDGVTIETALTITNERITLTADTDDNSAPTNVLDNVTGATSGTSNDLNYITGNDAGMMQLELSAANTNRVGRMMLSITDAANHVPVFHEFFVLPQAIYDWLTGVVTPLPANVTQISGDATAADNAESFFDGTGYAGTGNTIPTVTTLTNAPSDSAGVTTLLSRVGTPSNLGGGATISANLSDIEAQTDDIGAAGAGLTAVPWNASWDAEVQSEVEDGLVAKGLDHLVSASVTGTDVTDNSIIAKLVSKSATADWDTYDNSTDSHEAIRDKETDIETDTQDIQGRLPATLVSGRIDASVGAMAANTVNASALATDAVTEIQSGLATASALSTVDTVVDTIQLTTDKLDDTLEDDAGTYRFTANALEEAPSGPGGSGATAQEVWEYSSRTLTAIDEDTTTLDLDATVRAAVGLASANLDTQLGDLPTNAELSTALGTADDAVLAQIALVKAKTDNLPTDPADQSLMEAAITSAAAPLATQASVDTIQAKTDQLTFTVANKVDANTKAVNDTNLSGAGTSGDPWGPI